MSCELLKVRHCVLNIFILSTRLGTEYSFAISDRSTTQIDVRIEMCWFTQLKILWDGLQAQRDPGK